MRSFLIIFGLIIVIQSFGQEYDHVFVFLNSKPDKEKISTEEEAVLQKGHLENINRLVKEGKMTVAGPFVGGGGIFILTTGLVSEARAWLESDPAVKAKRWDIEIYPVKFLHGDACLAQEPYEMINYNFTRVNYINEIANYKGNQEGTDIWEYLVDEKNILMVGIFPLTDGGVIVYAGNERTSLFGNIQDEQVSLVRKQLWVAKGSFCE